MATYRARKSNIPLGHMGGPGLILRVTSNADGLTIGEVPYSSLPLARDMAGNVLGRHATALTSIEIDPDDEDWVILKTEDLALLHDPTFFPPHKSTGGDW